MDFDSIAAELAADHGIGSATKKKDSELDAIVKSLAEDHGIKIDPVIEKKGRLYVSPVAPPISGFSREASDELNRRPSQPAGENPRELIPSTSIQESMGNAGIAAKQLTGQGLTDIQSGHPYIGAAKVIGGVASSVLSPVTGAIEGGIEKPITEITGNPDIGSRAGFVAGSALPIAPTAKTIVGAIPKNKAFSTLVESIGPENVGNVAKEMRANPRLTPADLSPATRQTLQKLFVTEGDKTKNYLAETVKGRLQSAKEAVESAFDSSMGKTVDPVAKLKELKQNIRDVGSKQINPAIAGAKPVNLTPVIEHIDRQLKPGINSIISQGAALPLSSESLKQLSSIRKILTNDKSVAVDAKNLHEFQSALRAEADNLFKSGDPQQRKLAYALSNVRNKIVESIDTASGGKYKPALKNYKDEYDVQNAFQHGHDAIIKNSRNLNEHPSYFEDWVKNASNGEKEAAREGARVAYDTQVNGFKGAARRGTDIGQSDFNHRRMEALFGKEKADEMFKKLEHERLIAETNSDLVKGSQTAMRETADSRIALPTMKEVGHNALAAAALEVPNILGGGYAGAGTAAFGALKAGNYVKHEIATKLAKEHNANYAKLALPVEGPTRDELIKSLEAVANRQKPTMLSRANNVVRLFGP